jgi:hypothetical protein
VTMNMGSEGHSLCDFQLDLDDMEVEDRELGWWACVVVENAGHVIA